MTLAERSATELIGRLERGETSCAEIMKSALEGIERNEPRVRAFLHVRDAGTLLAEAAAVDARRARGEKIGALAGLPVAVKDNICAMGAPTTCASRMLADFHPPYDATVIRRLKDADGILLGKTNMDEFAMGSTTENSAMQVTRNPHDPGRVPGGTSGGSAAAVAAGETVLALGSDTGGSIRQPASFCGVVGMKPTYGRVSRYGLVAYGSSLDQIGPMGRTVADAALLLSVIAAHDPMDSTSIPAPEVDYAAALAADGGAAPRVGVPREYFGEGLDPEVRAAVESAIAKLEASGCEILPLSLPHTEYAVACYYIIACSEASSNLARYDGVHYGFRAQGCENIIDLYKRTRTEGFGAEVKRRILLGTYTLSSGFYDAYYLKASRVRALIARDFAEAFQRCDVILSPVAPTPAYRIGEKVDDPLSMYLGDIYSVTANLVGLPAISVPCGKTAAGLPIGAQLTAPHMEETRLLRAAARLEALLARS